MKKRAKLTPFAKIVILALVVLAARYAYIHREEIASGEFFNFSDTTAVQDTINVTPVISVNDSIHLTVDSLPESLNSSDRLIKDTVSIMIEKKNDVLTIKTKHKSFNVLLSDSVLISDTIFFDIPKKNNTTGRIIIK